jgi:hypothetical protein
VLCAFSTAQTTPEPTRQPGRAAFPHSGTSCICAHCSFLFNLPQGTFFTALAAAEPLLQVEFISTHAAASAPTIADPLRG